MWWRQGDTDQRLTNRTNCIQSFYISSPLHSVFLFLWPYIPYSRRWMRTYDERKSGIKRKNFNFIALQLKYLLAHFNFSMKLKQMASFLIFWVFLLIGLNNLRSFKKGCFNCSLLHTFLKHCNTITTNINNEHDLRWEMWFRYMSVTYLMVNTAPQVMWHFILRRILNNLLWTMCRLLYCYFS